MRANIRTSFFVTMLICAVWTDTPAEESDSSQVIADRIIKSSMPVLVDFWAPWCKPCHMLTPVIKAVAAEYAGQIMVIKINVDIHRQIAGYFRVTSIPAVFIVKNKAVVKFISGVQEKEVYIAAIRDVLAMSVSAGDSL